MSSLTKHSIQHQSQTQKSSLSIISPIWTIDTLHLIPADRPRVVVNDKDGKDIEVSLEGLNIAPSNLVQLDNDITNGEDSDDSDDDDGELVVEDVTNEQES